MVATGVGVAETTDSGIGVLAQATSGGVPFQVVVGSQPTLPLQSLQPGMIHMDGDGYWWIWQKDQTNVYDWCIIRRLHDHWCSIYIVNQFELADRLAANNNSLLPIYDVYRTRVIMKPVNSTDWRKVQAV